MSKMPEFTIKAKDEFAISTLIAYREECINFRLEDQAKEVQLAIEEMIDWRSDNPELVKYPDHKHIPAGEDITPTSDTTTYK
jgi:hypothetical protein